MQIIWCQDTVRIRLKLLITWVTEPMPTFVGPVNEASFVGGNQKSTMDNARRRLDVDVESGAREHCRELNNNPFVPESSIVSCINIVTVHFVWPRQIKHFMQPVTRHSPATPSSHLGRTMLFALAIGQFWVVGGRVCGHGSLNWHWAEQKRTDFCRLQRANFACHIPHATQSSPLN